MNNFFERRLFFTEYSRTTKISVVTIALDSWAETLEMSLPNCEEESTNVCISSNLHSPSQSKSAAQDGLQSH